MLLLLTASFTYKHIYVYIYAYIYIYISIDNKPESFIINNNINSFLVLQISSQFTSFSMKASSRFEQRHIYDASLCSVSSGTRELRVDMTCSSLAWIWSLGRVFHFDCSFTKCYISFHIILWCVALTLSPYVLYGSF